MRAEPARRNNGKDMDLEGWIAGSGNYALAIGYATVFWPRFVEIDGYIAREGITPEQLYGAAPRAARSRPSSIIRISPTCTGMRTRCSARTNSQRWAKSCAKSMRQSSPGSFRIRPASWGFTCLNPVERSTTIS